MAYKVTLSLCEYMHVDQRRYETDNIITEIMHSERKVCKLTIGDSLNFLVFLLSHRNLLKPTNNLLNFLSTTVLLYKLVHSSIFHIQFQVSLIRTFQNIKWSRSAIATCIFSLFIRVNLLISVNDKLTCIQSTYFVINN